MIQGLAKNTEVLEETDSLFLLWGQPPHQKWGLPRVGSGSSPGEGNGNPLQYSCREHLMDRGAWQAMAHGVAESDMTKVTEDTHTQAYCVAASTRGRAQQLDPGGLHPEPRGHLPYAQLCCWLVCVCVCWGWSVKRSRGGWVCLTLTSQQPGTSREGRGLRTVVQCEPRPVGLTQWPPSKGHTGCRA